MRSIRSGVDYLGLASLAVTQAKLIRCHNLSHAFDLWRTEMLSVVYSVSVVNSVSQGLP